MITAAAVCIKAQNETFNSMGKRLREDLDDQKYDKCFNLICLKTDTSHFHLIDMHWTMANSRAIDIIVIFDNSAISYAWNVFYSQEQHSLTMEKIISK